MYVYRISLKAIGNNCTSKFCEYFGTENSRIYRVKDVEAASFKREIIKVQ